MRSTSDSSFLESLGVELVTGDLCDASAVRRAVDGATIVYHCAAKVGDWGKWSDFQQQTIDATRHVVDACREAGVQRLLHVSSVSVYGHPRGDRQFTEEEPLGQNLWRWDNYPRAKIAAEAEARALGDRTTLVRPTWIYGPRDRSVIPRLMKAIQTGRISIIGAGDNKLNMIYASDAADGLILAAHHPQAGGQAYNLSSQGEITQGELLDLLCDAMNHPRITRRVSLKTAYRFGLISEIIGRLIRLKRAPYVTRRGVSLISRPTQFSSDKARRELGWTQRIEIHDGLRRTLASLKAE